MVRAMPPARGSRTLHPVFAFALAVAAIGASGCYRVPAGKRAVAGVAIHGTRGVDVDALEGRIVTRESPRFLGMFAGIVYDYELFDPYALRRDLQRIERWLRARGYYDARVHQTRIVERGDEVFVSITVDQGEPVRVESLVIAELSPVDDHARSATQRRVSSVLPIGAPFDEEKFAEAEKAALEGLTAAGHATATVKRRAEVDLATLTARLELAVSPGPLGTFGPIRIEGADGLPVGAIRRVFGVEEGARYSSDDLAEGREALLDLGLFASVEVEQDLEGFDRTHAVPITLKVEPAKLRAILAGVGVELDSIKTDVHGQIGWQSGNFLGGLRRFDVRFKPGLILYPTRFPGLAAPTDVLYEHRLSATVRQPAFLEKRLVGYTRAEYNVYPVLLPTATENVLGYQELRGETGLERRFWRRLFVSPRYAWQANFPFDYLGRSDGVNTLLISYVGLSTHLDYRDDPMKPRRGVYFGSDLQIASGLLQGDADDVRVQPEVRAFVPLPRRLTLALRGSVGFLFPFNYSKFSQINFATPGSSRAEESERDYQLLFFRGFFSGGPTSNRGYPLRGVGPHDLIPYLSPAGQSATAGGCNPNDPACLLPTGGLSLWEANAELRWIASGPFSTALFCDAGDVSPFSVDLRFNRPHLSCGAGARYDTPVGPIRLDVGYRIPGLQAPAGDVFEREPARLLGLPIAVAFGIGEAF